MRSLWLPRSSTMCPGTWNIICSAAVCSSVFLCLNERPVRSPLGRQVCRLTRRWSSTGCPGDSRVAPARGEGRYAMIAILQAQTGLEAQPQARRLVGRSRLLVSGGAGSFFDDIEAEGRLKSRRRPSKRRHAPYRATTASCASPHARLGSDLDTRLRHARRVWRRGLWAAGLARAPRLAAGQDEAKPRRRVKTSNRYWKQRRDERQPTYDDG